MSKPRDNIILVIRILTLLHQPFIHPENHGVRLKCGALFLHSGQKSRLRRDTERSLLYIFARTLHSVMLKHRNNFKILSEVYEI